MGILTLEGFRADLLFHLGNRNDMDAIDTTHQDRWINQAYAYMTHPSVHKFREIQKIETVTLVTGTNEYSISTLGSPALNVIATRFVTHVFASAYTPTARKQKIRPRGIRYFEQRTLKTGAPQFYTIDGETLFISPVPRSNENAQLLRIGHYAEPTVLVAAATTVLTSYYDRPLQKFTLAFAQTDLGDRSSALVTLREATSLLNNANEEFELEGEDTGWAVEIEVQNAMGPM